MTTKAQLVKWGNSLAVRIPKDIATGAQLKEGDRLVLEVESTGMVAMKAVRRSPTLKELLDRITPENRHAEQDWGTAQGAELW